MNKGFILKHLSFHGQTKKPATIEFGVGLNIISGASNTGKSFIIDAIDFMLGGKGPLRDIPERVGFDSILMAIETLDGYKFTISRSTNGGPFRFYKGLHHSSFPEDEGAIISEVHSEKNDENLSTFLLKNLGLHNKRIKKNKRNKTQSLSFRNIARLSIINEEEIIQQRSPLSDGNYSADTANTSVFKLLLTGVDDSSLVPTQTSTPEGLTRDAQISLLDQLIDECVGQVKKIAGRPNELEEQRKKLADSMRIQSDLLYINEKAFREATNRRKNSAEKLEKARNRLTEITTLLERFKLLEKHYNSDLERLQGIEEAGTIFNVLEKSACPLCGTTQDHQPNSNCNTDVSKTINAARAEISKIEFKQKDLILTISALSKEAISIEGKIPLLDESFSLASAEIDKVIFPNLRLLRSTYHELANKDSEVREALVIHRQLTDLEKRKSELEKENESLFQNSSTSEVELPSTTLDKFSNVVLDILKAWNFPKIERLHFDSKIRDLVINGKNRTSYGKGLRAITQTAFTIGLMKFCRENKTPHPGFVIIDSPLLSYKAPEGSEDDLRNTDLKDRFYLHLSSLNEDCQIIIIENTDPPDNIQDLPQSTKFSGIIGDGRVGYFPVNSSDE